ncbi:MAG: riboflavin synthase [Pseudomonadota bacterium]|nr:riboflavin synthase [Pseudomonadota bacterium]
MFTGIITDIGQVKSLEKRGDTRIVISTSYDTTTVEIGASIACSGPCLTVVERGSGWFATEASAETLSRTTVGSWAEGTRVNLERALSLGDELGGHIVSGHVDGLARIVSKEPEGDSVRFLFEVPDEVKAFIAEKGSVCLDGVSLTVNAVQGAQFGVNIISHTQSETTFNDKKVDDFVNLEVDMLARYVARLTDSLQNTVE